MEKQLIRLPSILTVTLIINFWATAKAVSPGMILDVSHNLEPTSQSGFLVINCSLASSLTDLETVASLAVFGSRPYGSEGDLEQLAAVDLWSNSPKLGNNLEVADISVSGGIDLGHSKKSALVLSWNSATNLYRNSYTCLANGINRKGEATSVSSTVKVQVLGNGACCQNIDLVSSELGRLIKAVEVTNTSAEVVEQVQGLSEKLLELEAKLETFHLSTRVVSTLSTIDKTKYDASRVYKDRIYLASRQVKKFDIAADNRACQVQGGYLVELDDNEELQFVMNFSKSVGGTEMFMTGGNDIEEEGVFTYFQSKKAVAPQLTWLSGQPDNADGQEDCMHIWLKDGGLNDRPCKDIDVKYVCEIPLRA